MKKIQMFSLSVAFECFSVENRFPDWDRLLLSFKSSHEVVVSLDPNIVLVEALEKDTNVALNCQKKVFNLI